MLGWYLPPMGLAAAMTEHLASRLVTMPALLMEMLCCSIANPTKNMMIKIYETK